MEAIKDTVQNVIEGLKNKRGGITGSAPQDLLKKILTKKELRHIKFSYFRRGVLDIGVDSSSWLYQLDLQKEDLLRKLNRELEGLKNIRFRLGGIK